MTSEEIAEFVTEQRFVLDGGYLLNRDNVCKALDIITELQAEVAKLREALLQISVMPVDSEYCHMRLLANMARAALEETK
jgi:hypothetical protein